jgi:hypothetical protein
MNDVTIQQEQTSGARTPWWGRLSIALVVSLCATAGTAVAQPKPGRGAPPTAKADKEKPRKDADKPTVVEKAGADKKSKNFDFNGIDLNGRMRTPQLLYFLERANEELERSSLEKRSFIPHMVRSVEETQL